MPLMFKEPHIIRASYRIVTPMFIGDAEQEASGISPASVKGALRFWWRALMWASACKQTDYSETEALKLLSQQESEIFGSSAEKGNASLFTLRVDASAVNVGRNTDWPSGRQNDSSSYLGLGLWKMGDQEQREYLKEDQCFSVELIVRDDVSNANIQSLKDALKAWGLLGGLGSRARRAFGSIAIESLDDASYKFTDIEQYKKAVLEIFEQPGINDVLLPPYTAISNGTSLGISARQNRTARSAHAVLGEAFKNYRGRPSSLRGSKKKVFGMPYSGGTKVEGDARRASPLMMHIHPVGEYFLNAVLFVPAIFYPDQELAQVDFSIAKGFLKALPEAVIL